MAVLHLLAAPMWLLIGYGQVRKRVGLDDDGIRIVQGYTRRRILWTDVASLKVDPPGGARIPRLTLTTGIDVPLPELTPAAREMLEQAYVSRPGIDGGSQPTEDESHGSTTEVPR